MRSRRYGSLTAFVPALLVPLIAFTIISQKLTADRLIAVEHAERARDLASVFSALDLQREALTKAAVDYARWDEMYDVIRTRDQAWFDKNVTDWVPSHFDVDVVALADMRGRVLFQCGSLPWPERELAALPFVRSSLAGKTSSGLVGVNGRLMLVAVAGVLRSDGSGPQRGVYLYGRWLGDEFAAQMKRVAGVDVLVYRGQRVIARSDPRTSVSVGAAWPASAAFKSDPYRFAFSEEGRTILTFHPLADIARRPVAVLATTTPRGAILISLRVLQYRSAVLLGVSVLLGLIAMLVAQARASMATSLRRITELAWQIAHGNELSLIADAETRGESGALSQALGAMTAAWSETKDALRSQTLVDPLTGLHNHRYLQDRLSEEVARAARYGLTLCVVMADIDRFKRTNDTFGHPVGDQILRELASLLRESFRQCDVVARYGGEEFMAILPETGLDDAMEAAERLRRIVEERTFRAVRPRGLGDAYDEIETRLTVSVGVAAYPTHSTTRDGLIMAADLALLMAKHFSRNTVRSYDQVPGAQTADDPSALHRMLSDGNMSTIETLAAAVDAKDHLTRGHSEAVTRYAVALAREIGLEESEVETVRTAGLLHDVGKIGIPDALLQREGPLSSADRRVMESHVATGAAIVGKAPLLAGVVAGVLYHHERYDGQGYPDGLEGEQIPPIARILAIADAYDAMTAERRYRPALSSQEALDELQGTAGSQFDPALARAFVRMVSEGRLQEAAVSPPPQADPSVAARMPAPALDDA